MTEKERIKNRGDGDEALSSVVITDPSGRTIHIGKNVSPEFVAKQLEIQEDVATGEDYEPPEEEQP